MSIVSNKPTITRNELEGVLDCLVNDELTSGYPVTQFEKRLSELTNITHTLAFNSATAAYHTALSALGVSKGDEVVLPSYFSQAALNALSLREATPVLIDIGEDSLSASPDSYRNVITEKTKAVITGHTGGIYTDSKQFASFPVPVIEEISHCLGYEPLDSETIFYGTVCISSFTPNDMITTGNGCALYTNNSRYYGAMRDLRNSTEKISYDYCMTDFQAAMGISQLSRLNDFIKRRREIARIYYDRVRLTPHSVLFPYNETYVYQSFPVIFDAPSDKVVKYFKKNGIELYRPVLRPLHLFLGYKALDFPNSDRMAKKAYSLPIYPTLSGKEIEKIGHVVAKFI